jgi:hypothetical protein
MDMNNMYSFQIKASSLFKTELEKSIYIEYFKLYNYLNILN